MGDWEKRVVSKRGTLQMSVRVTPDLYEWVKNKAKIYGVKMQVILKAIVEEAMENEKSAK